MVMISLLVKYCIENYQTIESGDEYDKLLVLRLKLKDNESFRWGQR